MQRKPVLGLGIDLGPCSRFVERIIALAGQRCSAFVCLANVHMVVEAHRDRSFGEVLGQAELVAPDGMPLVHALKWLHGVTQERVAGVDLLLAVLAAAEQQGLAVFVYGETEAIQRRLAERMQTDFPRLRIAGGISPPFRELSVAEEEQNVAAINASGAHLVLVALGCPRQELWMAGQYGRVQGVMIGLGAALGVYAGARRRAPAWMRRYCLEWFYRLLQEPRRLGRRYLVTNTLFLFLLAREILTSKFRQRGA